jgi:hypothetical protein
MCLGRVSRGNKDSGLACTSLKRGNKNERQPKTLFKHAVRSAPTRTVEARAWNGFKGWTERRAQTRAFRPVMEHDLKLTHRFLKRALSTKGRIRVSEEV